MRWIPKLDRVFVTNIREITWVDGQEIFHIDISIIKNKTKHAIDETQIPPASERRRKREFESFLPIIFVWQKIDIERLEFFLE